MYKCHKEDKCPFSTVLFDVNYTIDYKVWKLVWKLLPMFGSIWKWSFWAISLNKQCMKKISLGSTCQLLKAELSIKLENSAST